MHIYRRVSTDEQTTASQDEELRRWVTAYAPSGQPVKWHEDTYSGKAHFENRVGLQGMLAQLQPGDKVVIWRLDRLGRRPAALLTLLEEWREAGIGFVSVREQLDLESPAGRLMLVLLAGITAYESEVRSERQKAGYAALRDPVTGRPLWKMRGRSEKIKQLMPAIIRLKQEGYSVTQISRLMRLRRPSIYSVLIEAGLHKPSGIVPDVIRVHEGS